MWTLSKANKWWRPTASWGITITMIIWPWLIYWMLERGKTQESTIMIGVFATIVSTFLLLAGIRQNGKNKIIDTAKELDVAQMERFANNQGIFRDEFVDGEVAEHRSWDGNGANFDDREDR